MYGSDHRDIPNVVVNQQIKENIRRGFHEQKGNLRQLPELPPSSGGDTDFMIGSKYTKYFPKEIFQLPSGLSICKSHFRNVDGSRGVIYGPHEVFTEIDCTHHHHTSSFLASQREFFNFGYQVNSDVKLLGFKDDGDDSTDEECEGTSVNYYYIPRRLNQFHDVETAGSHIDYRCITHRECVDCKNSEHLEAISIKEEVEQDLISKSVHIDIDKSDGYASFSLIGDPVVKLAPNRHKAQKTYDQQMKHLERFPEDKESVIKSEVKLQQLGFVEWIKNLSEESQNKLRENDIHNFLPWRVVLKENSMTSPSQVVFDGSQLTDSSYSLNNLLPKETNMLNKLVEIFIR